MRPDFARLSLTSWSLRSLSRYLKHPAAADRRLVIISDTRQRPQNVESESFFLTHDCLTRPEALTVGSMEAQSRILGLCRYMAE